MEFITLKQILEKYPTKFNIEDINDNLLNKTIFGDGIMGAHYEDLGLDDLEAPTETEKNGKYKYTYKLGKYTLVVDNFLDQFTVDITRPAPGELPPYRSMWKEDGSEILF